MTRILIGATLLALIAPLTTARATAEPTGQLQQFHLIPSRSTLDVTRLSSNTRQRFFAYGTLGLNVVNGSSPSARFVDVQSHLVPDSSLTFVWDTDSLLNLSGLSGQPSLGDPSRLTFSGLDRQGVTFQITTEQHGRLLRIVGENYPTCCDPLKYRFEALGYTAPYADFNLDGYVDQGDAETLASHIGVYAHASLEQGDADGDGDVDGRDFLAWQRELGAATSMTAFGSTTGTSAGLASAVVPEPTTAVLVVLAAAGIGARRKRRR